MASDYDCIVIGGGPAGLTAATMLARHRRSVLLIHDNRPRNAFATALHGLIGCDGITPAELLKRGTAEAIRYGVTLLHARVHHVQRNTDAPSFEVAGDGHLARARRLLLATGLCDVLPTVRDFERYYGRSVHHCPDCDGYEVIGRRVAVLGRGELAVTMAMKLLTWTREVVLLTDGPAEQMDADDRDRLRRDQVPVVEESVVALEGDPDTGELRRVRLVSGEAVEAGAMFFNLGTTCAGDLYQQLGCEVDEKGMLKVDAKQRTSVEGVYAAGDLTGRSQLVVVAASEGAIAGIQVHESLEEEK